MKTICINGQKLSPVAREMLTHGHVPGQLSLACLRGAQKQWRSSYKRARERAAECAAQYGVRHGLTLIDSRWCRVWLDERGERVRIELAD